MYPFERFTDDAKKVLTLAQEEAERSQHSYIGTEHLLLALLATESEASRILSRLGVEAPDVRQILKAVLGRSERLNIQRIIPTSRVKKVIQLAFEDADHEGSTSITPTHLLLGLLREGEGIAAHVLQDRKVTIEKVMALRGPLEAAPQPWPVPGSRVLVHDADPPYRLWEGTVTGHDAEHVMVAVALHPTRAEARLPSSELHPVPLRYSGDCERCLAPGQPPPAAPNQGGGDEVPG